MRTYLLCMKKGVNSVGEKITKKWQWYIEELYNTPLGRLVKTTKWPKILECCLMKKRKTISNYWKTKSCKLIYSLEIGFSLDKKKTQN